jgi:hypothetical protein
MSRIEDRDPWRLVGSALAVFVALTCLAGIAEAQEPPPDVRQDWNAYIAENDRQVAADRVASDAFLAQFIYDNEEALRCRAEVKAGDVCIQKIVLVRDGRYPFEIENALVHHWIGSIFVPGVTLDQTLAFIKAYGGYPQYFEEVVDARVLEEDGDRLHTFMKLKRTKVITVHYNTEHDVTFVRHSPTTASSRSVATKIRELDKAGTPQEREQEFGDDQGFLWRLDANWYYEEVDGGVILEAEVISLSRSIPFGLGWMVGPFVDSIPRESLEATLTTLRDAIRQQ